MNPDISHLLALQEVDLEIRKLQQERDRLPAILQSLKDRKDKLQATRSTVRDACRTLEARARSLEDEADALRARKVKLQQQRSEVKTNQEYTALLSSMDSVDAEIGRKEEEALLVMEQADEAEAQAAERKRELDAEEARLAEEEKRMGHSESFLSGEIQRLLARREERRGAPSPEALARYEEILRTRGLPVLALAQDGTCSSCHMRLRPQYWQELFHSASFSPCENCRRLLYPPAES